MLPGLLTILYTILYCLLFIWAKNLLTFLFAQVSILVFHQNKWPSQIWCFKSRLGLYFLTNIVHVLQWKGLYFELKLILWWCHFKNLLKRLDACIANKSTWSIVHHHERRNWIIKEGKVCMLPFYFYYSLWLVELEKEGRGKSC
jgi:hypothetical protein